MSTGLIVIILLLFALVLYLILQMRKAKDIHDVKIKQLQELVLQLVKEQKVHSSKLKLSDELKIKINEARISLDENILELQHDLFSEIASKK